MKKRPFKIFVLVCFSLLAILVFGASIEAADNQQHGGTFKVIANRVTKSLGAPWEGDNWYNIYGTPAMESLVHLDKDGNILPHLATSWKIAPDGMSVIFSLRKGVKFHDGTDFNADAVKISLEKPIDGTWARRRKSIEILDDYTVKLNLKQPDNALLADLATSKGMIASPKAIAKTTTPENQAKDHMIGTGPYTFVDWSRDEYIKYKRFDGYWQKGKPYPDALEIIFIKDPVTSVIAFQTGVAQLIMTVSPKSAQELEAKGYDILSTPYGMKVLVPDGANPDSPWANRKVREALSYAINRDEVCDGIGLGAWFPAYQGCANKNWMGYLQGAEDRKYDPQRAKKLLAEAGYPNGFKTSIIAKTEENHDMLVALQAFLADINVTAKLVLMDRGRYVATHKDGWNNGILYANLGVDAYAKADNLRTLTPGDLRNKSVYRPSGFSEAYNKAASVTDPDEEKRMVEKTFRFVYDESMVIPVWVETQLGVKTKKLHDSEWGAVSARWWYPENVWLSK